MVLISVLGEDCVSLVTLALLSALYEYSKQCAAPHGRIYRLCASKPKSGNFFHGAYCKGHMLHYLAGFSDRMEDFPSQGSAQFSQCDAALAIRPITPAEPYICIC